MADKRYVVLEGQKYVGKHRTYIAGQDFPANELFGNAENTRIALEGSKDKIGKDKDGKEYLKVKGKDPKIKLFTPAKSGKK